MITKFLDSVERFLQNENGLDTASQFRSLAGNLSHATPAPLTHTPLMEDPFMSNTLEGTAEAEKHLDSLPYGAFLLDKAGTVIRYNDTEAAIHGGIPKECVGQNFFTEIAPCTRRPEFLGRFLDGVGKRDLNALFNFEFTFQGSSTRVWVCMKKDPHVEEAYWIFLKRL
jgi:photoactive yellow protein